MRLLWPGLETPKRKSAKTNNCAAHLPSRQRLCQATTPSSGRFKHYDSRGPTVLYLRSQKNFLIPPLKKAKQVADVKASIVGDKLVVNGHRYTFNNIPIQWRNTQSQGQYVQAQEIEDPGKSNASEMEPLQAEMPEITLNVFLQTFMLISSK